MGAEKLKSFANLLKTHFDEVRQEMQLHKLVQGIAKTQFL
jgi:hypothetical protein